MVRELVIFNSKKHSQERSLELLPLKIKKKENERILFFEERERKSQFL